MYMNMDIAVNRTLGDILFLIPWLKNILIVF